jgi:YggT family protein
MAIVGGILSFVLGVFFVLMWARFIIEMVSNFSRGWRPRGFGLIVAEASFTVTDPPIRLVRRFIRPLRIGGISLDFGWSIVMIVVLILLSITQDLSRL